VSGQAASAKKVTFQGLTQIRAFDGSKAWQVEPFQGRKDPAMMTDDDAKPMRLSADLDGAWVDAKARSRARVSGNRRSRWHVAHKLRVRLKWGTK